MNGQVERNMGEPLAGLQLDFQNDVAVLKPWGTLDLMGAAAIRPFLDEAAAAPCREYLVDMGGVSFIDGSGVRELMRVVDAAYNKGARMSIVNGSPRTKRLFALTGFLRKAGPAAC